MQKENSSEKIREDTVNSYSQDSFNKELIKKYEEHKKGGSKIPHRPISSYEANRNFNLQNKKIDSEKQIKNKPQSPQLSKSSKNSRNSNSKEQQSKSNIDSNKENNNEITINDLLIDLNNYLLSHKIKENDFIDNPNLFLNFDDFCEVFKEIHYSIPKKYLKMLFEYNNPEGSKDNYILMKSFIKNLEFYKPEEILNESDVSKFGNSNLNINKSSSKYSLPNKSENRTLTEGIELKSNKSIYELKILNEEYNQFNKDIINILTKSTKENNEPNYKILGYKEKFNTISSSKNNQKRILGKNYSSTKISIISRPKINNDIYTEENKSKERKIIKKLLNSNSKENSKIFEPKKVYDIKVALKNIEKQKEKEKNYIRFQFDKRDKELLKDCVFKCEECNRIYSLLGINKNYSITYDEEMKCKIEEEGKEDIYISLKELIIEWRRCYKLYHKNELLEKYKEREDINKNKNAELILAERKKEKEEKQKEIKEVLIEAVKLKTKLKSQLDDLKSNIKIDENIVLEHLKKAGMEIPIFNNKDENGEKLNKNNEKKNGK